MLRFIKKKMRTDAKEIVHIKVGAQSSAIIVHNCTFKDGKEVTMQEIFEQMGISSYDLSVDMLDVHADRNT